MNCGSTTCPEPPQKSKTEERDSIVSFKEIKNFNARIKYNRKKQKPVITYDELILNLNSVEYIDEKTIKSENLMTSNTYFVTFTVNPKYAITPTGGRFCSITAKQQYNQWKQYLTHYLSKSIQRYTLVFEFTQKGILHIHGFINWKSEVKRHIFTSRIKKDCGCIQQIEILKDKEKAIEYITKDQKEMIEEKLFPLIKSL